VSAVALASGASANAKYREGVAVFTAAKGGLMYEARVGGQKFGYEPLREAEVDQGRRPCRDGMIRLLIGLLFVLPG
jgi:hypothetical protein